MLRQGIEAAAPRRPESPNSAELVQKTCIYSAELVQETVISSAELVQMTLITLG